MLRGIEDELFPTVLQRASYLTFGVSTNACISPSSGFDSRFETLRYPKGGRDAGITPDRLRPQTALDQAATEEQAQPAPLPPRAAVVGDGDPEERIRLLGHL